jgi:pilus assembly protein FimV
VRRGETLGKIAESLRPAGVSLDQMMVSLYRENKASFDGNNMNRLRAGSVLRVPDAAALSTSPANEATREVRAQAADFNGYRQRVAGAVQDAPPVAADGGPAASGRIAPKVEEKVPAAAPGSDVLRVSKGDASKAGGRDPKAAQAAREEDATAREKALREATERVAALEKMLKDAQRLLDIQSKQLADLQKLAKAEPTRAPEPAKAAEPAKKAEAPKPEPVKAEPKPVPAAPEPKPEPSKAEPRPEPVAPAPEPVVEAEKPQEPAPPVQPTPPVEAAKAKPVPPPPPPPPSLVDQVLDFVNTYLTELGLGLVALFGIGALVARRKKGAAPKAAAAKVPAEPAVAAQTAGTASMTSSLVEPMLETQTGLDEVDPLAEAEVYLTYGREGQAEEILREAIEKTPARHELHLKLLGIYMKRGDASAFEAVARQLYGGTGGQGETWQKAAEMGASIDPANPLYAAGTSTAEGGDGALSTVSGGITAAAIASAGAVAAAAAAAPTRPIDTEQTQVLSLSEIQPADGPITVDFDFEPPAPAGTTPSGGDDEIVDIGGSADGSSGATAADMDFTLDFGSPATESVPALPDLPLEPPSDATETVEADLTFEPVMPSMSGEPGLSMAEPLFNAEATNVLLDSGPPTGSILDFKLEAARAEAEEIGVSSGSGPSTQPPLGQDTMIMADPGELVTFDMTHPAGVPQNWQETTLPRVDLDLGETNVDGSASNRDEHWNDVNTKYDLAKAYEEMGDKDGAREILREVIAEGDQQQKADAESMLARLG